MLSAAKSNRCNFIDSAQYRDARGAGPGSQAWGGARGGGDVGGAPAYRKVGLFIECARAW